MEPVALHLCGIRRTDIDLASIEPISASLLPPDLSGETLLRSEAAAKDRLHLENTALRATMWTVLAYGATQVIRLANNVVLTRLLLPQYFGLMALVSTLVLGMALLSDIGLLPSVVGSPRGDEPIFLNTAWTIQIGRGLILWCIASMLAFPLAALYGDHRIRLLLPILAFSMVLSGLASTNLLRAARNISVRRLLLIDLATQLFGIAVMVAAAWLYPSVWALVTGTLASTALKTILSHIPAVLPGEPNALAWDKSAVHSLVRFGKWIMIGTAFYFLATQADRLILGKLVSFTILGIYNIAFTVSDIPRQVMLQFSSRVGFPFVSKLVGLPHAKFRGEVLRYRFYVLCAGALLLALVILAGGPMVQRVYDKRYAAAVWMVPILALGLWHTLLYCTASDILLALGKPKYNAIGAGCHCATIVTTLPLAFHYYGLPGAVISVAAADFPLYLVFGIASTRQKVSLWRQDALATLMFLAILAVGLVIRKLV